ncbi:MAG: hypothetical protein NVS9B1_18360 [Candidatus Dormibacteraceae bacterium]
MQAYFSRAQEPMSSRRTGPGPDSTVAAATDQLSADLGGEVAILNLANGVYYGLDGAGALVWALLQEPRPVRDLVAAIVAAYEVDSATAESDLIFLLGRLAAEGLLEVTAP